MVPHDFFNAVMPQGARYCVRFISKRPGATHNRFYNTIQEVSEDVVKKRDSGFDIYYVTAGFGAGSSAEATNAVSKKELYVDIDCGPAKPYKSKAEGLVALRTFCKDVSLPQPTIIDSGNGLHAHWIFVAPAPVHEWTEVAKQLKTLCKVKNFNVDAVCTADVVRVLRPPGTYNSKGGALTELVNSIRSYEFVALKDCIAAAMPVDTASDDPDDMFAKARQLSRNKPKPTSDADDPQSLTKILSGGDPNRINVFEILLKKSIAGKGCAQIANAVEHSDVLSEPLWRGTLSIAQFCEDRDWAIHEVSRNHPNYSPEETESKASGAKGPYTCETFQSLESSHLCVGCPHAGKITSPIQLGAQIKLAPVGVPKVEVVGDKEFEIPPMPFPYVRGAQGGIYIKVKSEDDQDAATTEMVYPYDLYAYKRMREPELGDVVWLRQHMPQDGVREFILPQKEIVSADKLRDKLSEQGSTMFKLPQIGRIQDYLARSVQALQERTKAEVINNRFGWTASGTFIIGDREYTPKGVRYAPVMKDLERYVTAFTPKGTLEEWKSVMRLYNKPGFEALAFTSMAAYGSPLMYFTGESGLIDNLVSKLSGTGKTTNLRFINSVYGDPKILMKDAGDTYLSKVHRMGLMNGLPVCFDEMTNARPEEVSGLAYGCTQGRARDRMKSGSNEERPNNLSWKGIFVWSSNSALEDRLGTIKIDPQGEMARVIELYLEPRAMGDVLEMQKMFGKLDHNYGHAGHIYMQYVVENPDVVKKVIEDTREAVYAYHKWGQVDRFRLNGVICKISGGIIANSLGLTEYDIRGLTKYALELLKTAGVAMQETSTTAVGALTTFINSNIDSLLVIDGKPKKGLASPAYVKPRSTLIIRHEPDTKSLFIVQRDFMKWCGVNYLNAREIPKMFEQETGHKLEIIKKRMGAGWDVDFGPVAAYHIPDATGILGMMFGGSSAETD